MNRKPLHLEEKLRLIRNVLNLSSAQMAVDLGYSQKQYLRFESGETPIKPDLLDKIIEVYRVQEAWLYDEAYSENEPIPMFENGVRFKNTPEDVAERIKELRKTHQLTRQDFMARTGCTAATLSRLEQAKTILNPRLAKKICEVFEVGEDWLINGNEKRRLYPITDSMIEYLWNHPDLREDIWMRMKMPEE